MVGGGARRVHGDGDFFTGLERIALDVLLTQRAGAAPFKRPALHHAFVIGSFHLEEGVRVAQQQLNDLAFQRDGLVAVVGGTQGVVREGCDCREQKSKRCSRHCGRWPGFGYSKSIVLFSRR